MPPASSIVSEIFHIPVRCWGGDGKKPRCPRVIKDCIMVFALCAVRRNMLQLHHGSSCGDRMLAWRS